MLFKSSRGGEEPNDYNGDSEECTFVIPETPGNFLSLDEGGPMWGDINCMTTEFQWPANPNSYVRMVPICEGKFLLYHICQKLNKSYHTLLK